MVTTGRIWYSHYTGNVGNMLQMCVLYIGLGVFAVDMNSGWQQSKKTCPLCLAPLREPMMGRSEWQWRSSVRASLKELAAATGLQSLQQRGEPCAASKPINLRFKTTELCISTQAFDTNGQKAASTSQLGTTPSPVSSACNGTTKTGNTVCGVVTTKADWSHSRFLIQSSNFWFCFCFVFCANTIFTFLFCFV